MKKLKILGYKKCPVWLKKVYRKSVNYICQECKKHEDQVGKLIPHRLTRGNSGGLYTICPLNSKENNVKIICLSCHKRIHSLEFQ